MANKKIIVWGGVAVLLGSAAVMVGGGRKTSVPKLNGEPLLPGLDRDAITSVEVGDTLKLVSDTNGWTVVSYHGYPADAIKLTKAISKLAGLTVGQVVRGKTLEKPDNLVLRDSAGRELARLALGERHAKWDRGRYVSFKGETVLVSDALEDFDGDGKSFVDTKIVDTPYVSFNDIVEGLPADELGFATGVVAKVTIAGDTNRTVTVGNKTKDGTNRYLKLDRDNWVFTVPAYSVESLLPKPPPEKPDAKPAEEAESK